MTREAVWVGAIRPKYASGCVDLLKRDFNGMRHDNI